jgi:hypothetical protein
LLGQADAAGHDVVGHQDRAPQAPCQREAIPKANLDLLVTGRTAKQHFGAERPVVQPFDLHRVRRPGRGLQQVDRDQRQVEVIGDFPRVKWTFRNGLSVLEGFRLALGCFWP